MDRETVDEIKRHFGVVVEDLRLDVHRQFADVHQQLAEVRKELRETVDETKRHVGVVVEDVRSEIRAVAEGQQMLANQVHAGFAELRKEAQETRAMVHLSYVEVDRRLRDLEAGRRTST